MRSDRQFFGGLESLRGIAAALVVFFHMIPYWHVWPINSNFVRNGYLMVDLFFVLSGFVICHSYGGAELSTFRGIVRFMVLRFGRLYPLHFIMLIVFLGIEVAKWVAEQKIGFTPHTSPAFSQDNPTAFTANLFLVHPFFSATNLSFNPPSWSIGVEYYTYLVFGSVFLWLPRRNWLMALSATFAVLFFLLLWQFGEYYLNSRYAFCFLRCLLGFFLGVMCHEIHARYSWARHRDWRMEVFLTIVLIAFLEWKPEKAEGWDYVSLLLFGLLTISLANSSQGFWNWAPFRWLGKVSYSIYMLHAAVIMLLSRIYEAADHALFKRFPELGTASHLALAWTFVFMVWALVLGLSQRSYNAIELPFQKRFRALADRWFERREPKQSVSLAIPIQPTTSLLDGE